MCKWLSVESSERHDAPARRARLRLQRLEVPHERQRLGPAVHEVTRLHECGIPSRPTAVFVDEAEEPEHRVGLRHVAVKVADREQRRHVCLRARARPARRPAFVMRMRRKQRTPEPIRSHLRAATQNIHTSMLFM